MPAAASWTPGTANSARPRLCAGAGWVAAAQYVAIRVSRQGAAWNETVERAFEPFFTTKEVGKGTGSACRWSRFRKQSGGDLQIIRRARAHGALPAAALGDGPSAVERETAPEGARDETIWCARMTTTCAPTRSRCCASSAIAWWKRPTVRRRCTCCRSPAQRVDLLFTDVVLPGGMTGALLAREAQALRPGLKTLFTTGYARDAIVHQGRLDAGVELITKPFSYGDLAARVRDMLDGAA
jgi:CheY-like chemotaxis protein